MSFDVLHQLARNRKGASAVEYGLIAALVVITMIVSFKEVASTTTGMWGNVNNQVSAATGH